MDKPFTVYPAHWRRTGGSTLVDARYDEWTCPECNVTAYVPVAARFESLSCFNPDHGETPVWMTKSPQPVSASSLVK